jgi:Rrf2 family protein
VNIGTKTVKLSKKCVYALRAVFELAGRNTSQPVKIHDIAKAQGISPRFLEVIMNELRHAGFVESRRGAEGGYMLAKPPTDITVGDIISYIHGPISIAGQNAAADKSRTFFGDTAFSELWHDINNAVTKTCNERTFADMVESEQKRIQAAAPNYVI